MGCRCAVFGCVTLSHVWRDSSLLQRDPLMARVSTSGGSGPPPLAGDRREISLVHPSPWNLWAFSVSLAGGACRNGIDMVAADIDADSQDEGLIRCRSSSLRNLFPPVLSTCHPLSNRLSCSRWTALPTPCCCKGSVVVSFAVNYNQNKGVP